MDTPPAVEPTITGLNPSDFRMTISDFAVSNKDLAIIM